VSVSGTSVLDAVRRNDFLVIGRAGMDFYPDPPGTRTEDAGAFVAGLGGSAANTAVGIVRLGGRAALVTRVSDDAVGRFCLARLRDYGVDTAHVTPVGGEFRTSLAVSESRMADHQTVIYRNGAADFRMDEEDIARIDFAAPGALVTAGTVLAAEPSRAATFAAFDRAKAAGLPVIFDIDYRPYSWPSPQVAAEVLTRAGQACAMVVGNDEEFGFMAGGYEDGLAMARHLAATTAEIVVYKRGPEGAITFAGGEEIHTGIYPVEALKPVGSGDSFMAGLLTAIADGHPLRDALMRASACAAITVTRPGCALAMPGPDDLNAFLADHPGPTG